MRIIRLLQNSSNPYVPSSRPKPERLTPPNGSSDEEPGASLIDTMPDSSRSATRSAASTSAECTDAPRPNSVSFAMRTASSSSAALYMTATGPKISSLHARICGVTPASTVGVTYAPGPSGRLPPTTTSAPASTASSICA